MRTSRQFGKVTCVVLILATVLVLPWRVAKAASNGASMLSFQIPSHGAQINAFVYTAAGTGRHPAVVLLHGFPGNERNLDMAQEVRLAGWDVLYFDYRGTWGSPGDFSFAHAVEDTLAAVDYLRSPAVAEMLNLDPGRIVLVGHSMGGFAAVEAAAADPRILGIVLISAADIGGRVPILLGSEGLQGEVQALSRSYENWGMAPIAGCTAESLARETVANAGQWRFMSKLSAFQARPMLIVTSEDGNAQASQSFASALRRAGNTRVSTLHLMTDHAYSDQRGPLVGAVLRWLATITQASPVASIQ